jgi:hypothetical protein
MVESLAVKKRVSSQSAAVKSRLYVRRSYSEILIITLLTFVDRIRIVKAGKRWRYI